MNKFKEFQDSFISYFLSLYKEMNGRPNESLDAALKLRGKSEEERDVIQEVCKDVDQEHDMIEEMVHSNKKAGDILMQDIIDTVKGIRPDATGDEISLVIETTKDAMEGEIELDAKELSKETDLLYGNSVESKFKEDN